MSVLQVLHIPDERLRKVAKPVEEVNAEIQRIVDDMFETMYAERHCCKVSDEAAFCLIQRPYISKTLLTRRISPRGSP